MSRDEYSVALLALVPRLQVEPSFPVEFSVSHPVIAREDSRTYANDRSHFKNQHTFEIITEVQLDAQSNILPVK